MSFYEPVAANVAIFVALIALDIYNKANSLIPVHAIAGVLITFMTLYLCRSNYITVAWVFTLIPGIFLLVTFLTTASKNEYVIGAGNKIKGVYTGTVDTAKRGFDSVYNTVDYLYDEGKEFVDDVNKFGSKAGESASDWWMRLFNQNKSAGKSDGAAAIAATAGSGIVPPANTEAGVMVQQLTGAVNSTVIKGEYAYLCGGNAPSAALAEHCSEANTQCAKDTNPNCRDTAIRVLKVHAVCLGSLATNTAGSTNTPPSTDSRDKCIACEKEWEKNFTSIDQCRCTAMNNCPKPSTTVTGFSNYGASYFPA